MFISAIQDMNIIHWNKNKKKNPFGPIKEHLPEEDMIIERTEKAIFKDAAICVAASCFMYFKIKDLLVINSLKRKAIACYERVRVGVPGKRQHPGKDGLITLKRRREMAEKIRAEVLQEYPGIKDHILEYEVSIRVDKALASQTSLYPEEEVVPKKPPKKLDVNIFF